MTVTVTVTVSGQRGGVMSSVLIFFLVMAVAAAGLPEGYEYAWGAFGETQPTLLKPSVVLASGDQFGKVVAVWDGLAAVSSGEVSIDSSSGQTGLMGKVFLFHQDYLLQWVSSEQYFTTRLTNDGFGDAVALYDGLLAVGAPQDSSRGNNRGLVYIYSGDGFASTTSIAPTEHADDDDYFGSSVAITPGFTSYYGGTVVVGAYGHNKNKEHEEVGCVFVFARESNIWTQIGYIEPSFPVNHGGFGYSLASYGNTIAVGSYGSDLVHVFELHGVLHECPHADPEHGQEDLPEACRDEDDTNDDGNDATDDASGANNDYSGSEDSGSRLRRVLQPREEDKKFYREWLYEEELVIGFENREHHDPEDKDTIQHFGASVAVYNQSGLVTVAVGCSECVTSNNRIEMGAVYVFSELKQSDAADGWYPDDYHPDDHPRRQLQEGEEEKHKFLWDPNEHSTHASRTGAYWVKEKTFYGRIQYENFGYSISIDGSNLLVGTNPDTDVKGRAEVYSRRKLSYNNYDFIQSGPLAGSTWTWGSNLPDVAGITGDKFGFSVAMDGGVAVVGSILGGQLDDGSLGSGAAYVYQRRYVRKIQQSDQSDGNAQSDSGSTIDDLLNDNTLLGISFISVSTVIGFCATLALFYGVYRVSGGESSPRKLVLDLLGVDERDATRSSRPLRLTSALDDSTSSVDSAGSRRGFVPNSSAYSGLSTSSSHGRPSSSKSSPYQSRPQYVPKGPPKPSYSPAKKTSAGLDDL